MPAMRASFLRRRSPISLPILWDASVAAMHSWDMRSITMDRGRVDDDDDDDDDGDDDLRDWIWMRSLPWILLWKVLALERIVKELVDEKAWT